MFDAEGWYLARERVGARGAVIEYLGFQPGDQLVWVADRAAVTVFDTFDDAANVLYEYDLGAMPEVEIRRFMYGELTKPERRRRRHNRQVSPAPPPIGQ